MRIGVSLGKIGQILRLVPRGVGMCDILGDYPHPLPCMGRQGLRHSGNLKLFKHRGFSLDFGSLRLKGDSFRKGKREQKGNPNVGYF
jgi:hypothetical protein